MHATDTNALMGAHAFRNPEAPWGGVGKDGHCQSKNESYEFMLYGLAALLEENTDTSRNALRNWLPSASELLYIAEHELFWHAHSHGQAGTPLLCALLHGERLGNWELVVEVTEGVLRIEAFNPLVRVDALRLLGRAQAALGQRLAARVTAERAAVEAAAAP